MNCFTAFWITIKLSCLPERRPVASFLMFNRRGSMKDLDATDLTPPVALTESEIESVAGGLALTVGRLGGCPGCTSGGYLDLASRFTQIVNPAISVGG
jgi:hypothetical protein